MLLLLSVVPRCGEMGGALVENSGDGTGRDAETAEAELQYGPTYVQAIAVAVCPLPFDTGPQDALDRTGMGSGIDVGETTLLTTPFQLVDQRRHDLGIRGTDHLGGGEHLGLRLERHLPQVGLDLVAEG